MKPIPLLLFTTILVLVFACSSNHQEYKQKVNKAEFIHRSLRVITDRIVHDIFSPPVASRIYAYSSIAAYEVIIQQSSVHQSLAGQLNGLTTIPQPEAGKEYCYTLAATEAMLKVGRTLIFSESDLDVEYGKIMNDFREADVPDEVMERSIAYGKIVADHILAWAALDNYKQTRSFPKYSITQQEEAWRPTPPAYMDGIEPHWNKIRTFVIDSAAQFRPQPPTSFSTDATSDFFKEATEVHTVGKNLSEEQKSIANFWDCNPFVMNIQGHVMYATKKISPGGHWMNITRLTCTKSKADPATALEAYTLVALSLADGFISCWDEKYRSTLVRPETYINQHIDENWTPLLQTPPFPEYTSGHSVVSNASAVALTSLFGDNFSFTDSTEIDFGIPARTFASFQQAADEASVSRLYGGIHYRPAIENGTAQGRAVGTYILSKLKTRK
jgi:hypothetical protein